MIGKLTKNDIQQCEARLSQRRAALRAVLDSRGASESGAEAAPAPVEVHDLKDDAFADQIASVFNTALTHVQDELTAVQAALQRIKDGSYGSCSVCNRDIGRGRLLAQPSAERCLLCQQRTEGQKIAHRS